ncbi:Upf1 domain-containing protein [Entamoeba marina]
MKCKGCGFKKYMLRLPKYEYEISPSNIESFACSLDSQISSSRSHKKRINYINKRGFKKSTLTCSRCSKLTVHKFYTEETKMCCEMCGETTVFLLMFKNNLPNPSFVCRNCVIENENLNLIINEFECCVTTEGYFNYPGIPKHGVVVSKKEINSLIDPSYKKDQHIKLNEKGNIRRVKDSYKSVEDYVNTYSTLHYLELQASRLVVQMTLRKKQHSISFYEPDQKKITKSKSTDKFEVIGKLEFSLTEGIESITSPGHIILTLGGDRGILRNENLEQARKNLKFIESAKCVIYCKILSIVNKVVTLSLTDKFLLFGKTCSKFNFTKDLFDETSLFRLFILPLKKNFNHWALAHLIKLSRQNFPHQKPKQPRKKKDLPFPPYFPSLGPNPNTNFMLIGPKPTTITIVEPTTLTTPTSEPKPTTPTSEPKPTTPTTEEKLTPTKPTTEEKTTPKINPQPSDSPSNSSSSKEPSDPTSSSDSSSEESNDSARKQPKQNPPNHQVSFLDNILKRESKTYNPQLIEELYENGRLNKNQKTAVLKALNYKSSLIFGPPGTGKTEVAAQIVNNLHYRNSNTTIIATAASNTAVNALAERILQCGKKVIRVVNDIGLESLNDTLREYSIYHYTRIYAQLKRNDEMYKCFNERIKMLLKDDEKKLRKSLNKQFADSPSLQEKYGTFLKYWKYYTKSKKSETGTKISCDSDKDDTSNNNSSNGHFDFTKVNPMLEYMKNNFNEIVKYCRGGDPREKSICVCITLDMLEKYRSIQDYDYLVVDEAPQALELQTLSAIFKAKNGVLIGDIQQLAPTLRSNEASLAGYGTSMFQRLMISTIPRTFLNINYRMHPTIAKFCSQTFYSDELKNSADLSRAIHPNLCDFFPNKNVPIVFIESEGEEHYGEKLGSFGNIEEKLLVESVLKELHTRGIEDHEIGIISPYSTQRDLIQTIAPSIEVVNIDGFQGNEKDVVILSCTRSNYTKGIGFLSDKKRINVALSRSKHGLIVIGNITTLQRSGVWRLFLTYCNENNCIVKRVNGRNVVTQETLRPVDNSGKYGIRYRSTGYKISSNRAKKHNHP